MSELNNPFAHNVLDEFYKACGNKWIMNKPEEIISNDTPNYFYVKYWNFKIDTIDKAFEVLVKKNKFQSYDGYYFTKEEYGIGFELYVSKGDFRFYLNAELPITKPFETILNDLEKLINEIKEESIDG